MRVNLLELLQKQFPGVKIEDIYIEIPDEVLLVDRTDQLIQILMKMLRFEEGSRLKEYLCSKGYPTIGIGHKITPADRKTFLATENGKMIITEAQEAELFQRDIQIAIDGAKRWIGQENWDKLSVNRQAVCVGMVYQMGIGSVMNFQQTRGHILAEEWEDVAQHFITTKWYQDTPNRVKRMAKIMRTNTLPKEYDR
jgi:GH24 family phage-related lysozyme (muramidase)